MATTLIVGVLTSLLLFIATLLLGTLYSFGKLTLRNIGRILRASEDYLDKKLLRTLGAFAICIPVGSLPLYASLYLTPRGSVISGIFFGLCVWLVSLPNQFFIRPQEDKE